MKIDRFFETFFALARDGKLNKRRNTELFSYIYYWISLQRRNSVDESTLGIKEYYLQDSCSFWKTYGIQT
jgi:hypothetical protein